MCSNLCTVQEKRAEQSSPCYPAYEVRIELSLSLVYCAKDEIAPGSMKSGEEEYDNHLFDTAKDLAKFHHSHRYESPKTPVIYSH